LADAGQDLLVLPGGSESGALRAMNASAEGPGTPALTPVPQELIATIEARFRTTDVSLPSA
jgi:hypothetical protein